MLVHQGGDRATITVKTKADAEGICREIRKQELAGVNVVQAIRTARAPVVPTVMPLDPAQLRGVDAELGRRPEVCGQSARACESDADPRRVRRHIVTDRHDHVVAALDKYLLAE